MTTTPTDLDAVEAIATRLERRAAVSYGTAAASLDLDAATALRALLAEVAKLRAENVRLVQSVVDRNRVEYNDRIAALKAGGR
jgi:ribosomal protein L18